MPQGDVEIRLLGPVEAVVDGRRVEVGGRRARTLIALLGMEAGRAVSSDRLIEELWGDEPTDGAAVTLKVHVSRLRTALGPQVPIVAAASAYRLDLPATAVDVSRFEALVVRAREQLDHDPRRAAATASAALALWRGGPFGDVGDEGTLATHGRRLEELRLEALELRFDAELRAGRSAELVADLEGLVAAHPHRERAWRHLMLALYRAGRPADALGAYHRARAALDAELGIDPGPELVELEAAILRGAVPPVAPPPARDALPTPMTSFVGRRDELDEIGSLLAETRLVTLTGVGGVGKTRLGIEAARAAAAAGSPDGAWFVDLARLSSAGLVAGEIATAVEAPDDAASDPADRIVRQLRDLDALLVLDNCEHLVEACATVVAAVLAHCPRIRVLATSRVPLGVAGERAYAVPPLTLSPSAPAGAPGPTADALELFVARARAAHPGLELDPGAVETAAAICRALEGLPLAIELAAARARSLTLTDIAERLGDRFRFLVSWRWVATARHRTLREAMDWSFDLLGPAERRLFERLAVFSGGFDLEAVGAVGAVAAGAVGAVAAGDEAARPDDATGLDALERLIDASLVIPVGAATGASRYVLLETVREYAGERLASGGDEADARDRHARHFLGLVARAAGPIRDGPDSRSWMDRLTADRDNIRAALGFLRDNGRRAELLAAAEGMWWYWWIRGEAVEGRGWLETAVDGLGAEVDPTLLGRAFLGLAGLTWSRGDFEAAHAAATRADEIFEQIGDVSRRGRTWNTIGVIAHGRRDFEAAAAAFGRSIELGNASDVEPAAKARYVAIAMDNLGSALLELGDLDGAVGQYEAARRLHLDVGGGEESAMYDLHLGRAAIRQGRHEDAASLLASAMDYYRGLGFLQYVTESLEGAAMVANARGAFEPAATMLGAAATLRERTRVPLWGGMQDELEAAIEIARAALDSGAFQAAWDAGQADPEAALDAAVALLGEAPPAA